jgi:hypothetical protein
MDDTVENQTINQTTNQTTAEGGNTPLANISASPVAPKKRGRPRALNGQVTQKDVINAINQTGGMIVESCNMAGISICDFYNKFRYNPKVEEALKQARRRGFEQVTDVLIQRALDGDMKAISLYLKYNPEAKAQNWVENQTLTLREEKPLTAEEKADLAKQLFG